MSCPTTSIWTHGTNVFEWNGMVRSSKRLEVFSFTLKIVMWRILFPLISAATTKSESFYPKDHEVDILFTFNSFFTNPFMYLFKICQKIMFHQRFSVMWTGQVYYYIFTFRNISDQIIPYCVYQLYSWVCRFYWFYADIL